MRVLSERGWCGWLLLGGLLLTVGCSERTERSDAQRPSILLITVDGLVSDDLAAFGGEIELPAFERLVSDGVAWPAAQSAAPMTRPAVASYLTGLAPDRHTVRDDLFATLPEAIPTLAERLATAGYRTAGFPDSAFLIESSGLWRGFEIVDGPPTPPINAARWLPRVRPIDQTSEDLDRWLATIDRSDRWFAWVHISYPLIAQFKQKYFVSVEGETKDAEPEGFSKGKGKGRELVAPSEDPQRDAAARDEYLRILQEFDSELSELLELVRGRDADRTLILLAGTMGDQRGREGEVLPGIGYALDPIAVNVPVVVNFPAGVDGRRAADAAVWTLDVPSTIAELAGVALDARAEGVSLTAAAPQERIGFSFSWALRDQMGWRELALARRGADEVMIGNPQRLAGDSDAEQALVAALDSRENPEPLQLDPTIVEPLLKKHEISGTPYPDSGREFDDIAARDKVAGWVWFGRHYYQRNNIQQGGQLMNRTVRFKDADNFGARLDRAQMMWLSGIGGSQKLLKEALSFRPLNADAWHWYAHSIWGDSWQDAEEILLAIQPQVANQSDVLYDLACSRSLAEDIDASALYLERAWIAGYRNRAHLGADPDLRNLRESEKFAETMRKFD